MIDKTTTALLEGMADPANEAVWRELDLRYRPILVGFARRLGLGAEDAADAAQETLARVVRGFRDGRYQRQRGRLRSWIFGIAQRCAMDVHAQRARRRESRGMSAVDRAPDDREMTRIWDAECRSAILARAMQELRQRSGTSPQTVRAFEMVALEGWPPAEAARELGVTTNDVYLAKHRCLRRLRAIVTRLTDLYELGEDMGET